MKQQNNTKYLVVNILIFTFIISSCGTDSKKDTEVTLKVSALSVNEISKKLIFNPKSTQNYLVAINDLESLEDTNNRTKLLLGMAHMYQGEVYKIAATLMREIQQDLYTESSNPDPAHGEKFPIADEKDFGEIRDELLLLLSVDAFFLGQSQKSKLIASRINESAGFSHLITKLNSKTSVEHSGTYLGWLDYKNEFPNPDAFPDELINYLKAETIYKSAGPKKALDFMDEHKIMLSNYFDDHTKVSYYNASAYDLAGLIHFQLAQEQLGNALKDDSSDVDTFQRILNIIYYVNNGSKIGIQSSTISVLNSETEYLLKHAKEFNKLVNQGKHAYELDYIYFKNNVLKMDKVPIGIESLFSQIKQSDMSQAYEKYLFTNSQFIGSPLYLNLKKIENDLIKMKQYPTLMSGIVESINLTGAKEDKPLVQKFSDGLSFNLAITDNSWHRNRVGYVISLLGSLRWHGGRVPNCMEFIIQESNKNPRLKSLKNVVKLFLGGFHGLQSD